MLRVNIGSVAAFFLVLAGALLLAPGCDRRDVLSENPDLATVAAEWSEEERDGLRRTLESLSAEERRRAVEEILSAERERITVESVFVKFAPSPPGGARGHSIRVRAVSLGPRGPALSAARA